MPKALCILGIIVAGLMLLAFGMDAAIKFPFQRINLTMDIGCLISSLMLGYISWTTLKEQK
jgi:hypothetical protein